MEGGLGTGSSWVFLMIWDLDLGADRTLALSVFLLQTSHGQCLQSCILARIVIGCLRVIDDEKNYYTTLERAENANL